MDIYKQHKTAAIIGAVFGFLAPFIGIFFGLQVSTILGNILAFPLILISMMTGEPFWNLPITYLLLGILLSIIIWSLIFVIIADLKKKISK